MASYTVNRQGVAHARRLIKAKRYVLKSDWGEVQPKAVPQLSLRLLAAAN